MHVPKLPKIPENFRSTKIWNIYVNLKHHIESNELNKIIVWTEENSKKLAELNERLKTDDPGLEANKLRRINKQLNNLAENIQNARSKISPDNCEEIIEQRCIAIDKRNIANDGAKVLSTATKFDGIGTETWLALWSAARDYSTSSAYKGKSFPNIKESARCVFCHQQLDADTRDRLSAFNAYVTGNLQTDAKTAETALEDSLISLPKTVEDEDLKTACHAAELSDEISEKVIAVWKEIQRIITALQTATINKIREIDPSLFGVIYELTKLSETNDAKARQYDNDAKSFDRVKATGEALELHAKEWATQQVTAIKAELVRLEQVSKYDEWKSLTSTIGLSKKAGQVSKALITDAYISRFNKELQKLGAKKISVELIKTSGDYARIKHQVRLKGLLTANVKTSEILSEGEKRIVLLAAFLADVTKKPITSPFIFDDPISSLDQIYEEKTIDRLIELSQNRQVLVFTHRLSFLGIINDRAAINTVHVRCEPWGTGEPGEIPIFGKAPDKALKNLQNDRLIKAEKVLKDEGSKAYYPLAKSLCSDIRILMERIVETVLLDGVVQRHRRDVQTKNKIHTLSKIKKEDCNFIEKIMTKYSCYEHSQSEEAPVELPKPNELTTDINKILSWHEGFKGRKI